MAETTRAETETLFSWDNEEQVLHACTADARVAERWRRGKLSVQVMSRTREGAPRTWNIDLPFTKRGNWIRAFSRAVPQFTADPILAPGALPTAGGET